MANNGATMYPVLTYEDAREAMSFLNSAFGFEELMVVPGENGSIVHAEMNLGSAVIMLGSNKPEMGWMSPKGFPAVAQTLYVAIDDVDTHYAKAKAAGAEITRELNDTDYGSREYGARDPEGHHWSFGTYRPSV
jgi:uncharacterized glyoxalase superfamily protein PhnB